MGNPVKFDADGYFLKIFPLEIELINIAFHYAFSHGFKRVQWLIDICTFIKKHRSKIDLGLVKDMTSPDLRKILGLIWMLSYQFIPVSRPDKEKQLGLNTGRLLPFEYRIYKNMTFRSINSLSGKLYLRSVKILLPYRLIDRFRVLKYLIFNTDSIRQRLEPHKSGRNIFLPLYLIKFLVLEIKKKIKN
jgi:hypothetical protein